ncbi:MAG TPA: hypothetical protein GXX35_03995 [Thermoanaerobacterales bacterium]|nr:hypothetical protein [Thermoanaerobacterales bacterium]
MEQKKAKSPGKCERREEIDFRAAERKEDLDRLRGMKKVVDPERGPENKR